MRELWEALVYGFEKFHPVVCIDTSSSLAILLRFGSAKRGVCPSLRPWFVQRAKTAASQGDLVSVWLSTHPPPLIKIDAIDLQKMNWKFRTGFHEHTGVSLIAPLPNNPIGGYTRVHQDTAQSRHRQRSAPSSAARLAAR